MIPISQAIKTIREKVPAIGTETVPILDSVGRVLAEDIRADLDLPPFDRSQMDGFAIISDDTRDPAEALEVVGESAAGHGWDGVLKRGQAVKTMTGARVPEGADAVQQIELAEESDGRVRILKEAPAGKNIVRRAAEIARGDVVLRKGERITRQMVASLAAFGYSSVRTGRRPRLGILSTGSEIVDIDMVPGKDQIRNSNSAMLAAFADGLADAFILPIAPDDPDGLKASISRAMDSCDCLVISGGVSVGDYDFTKPVLRDLGADIHFEKLSLKPGKPTVFATAGDKVIFGLPGNPVSIAVTFLVFARMALLMMQGAAETGLAEATASVTHDIRGTKGRDGLLPVKTGFSVDGKMLVESLKFSGSSNFVTFAKANALAFVPADAGLKAGETTKLYFF